MPGGRYTRIRSKFWGDEKVKTWDGDTKLLALYILTSPHNNMIGCYILPKLYICADLGMDLEQLHKPFAKLLEDGFIKYDEQNNLILINNFLKHNPIENKNQAIAATKIVQDLPRSPLLSDLKQFAEQLGKPFLEQFIEQIPEPVTVSVTVSVTVDNNICATESHDSEENTPAENSSSAKEEEGAQERECAKTAPDCEEQSASTVRKSPGKGVEYSRDFEEFWKVYPRKKEKMAAYKCYLARLKEGHLPRDMLEAARRYRAECKKNRTEEKYIKLGKTFLGPNKPFEDYLKQGKVVSLHGEFKPYTGEEYTEFRPYRG